MALDWIGFINANVSLTTQQKIDMLDDFCEAYDYQETLDDGSSNPVSKKDFANSKFDIFIQGNVNKVRREREEAAVSFTELDLS